MSRFVLSIITLLLAGCLSAFAEAVGKWTLHLSYSSIEDVAPAGSTIYVKANGNLFSYNKNDHSVKAYTPQEDLSASDITHIAWVAATKKLLIVYADYTIDLLTTNETIETILGLKTYTTTKSKAVKDVTVNGRYAYLTTGIGILKVDTKDAVIMETLNDGTDIPADTREKMTAEEFDIISGKARPDGPMHPEHYYLKMDNGRLYSIRGRFDYNDVSSKNPGNVQVFDGSRWTVMDTTMLSGLGRNYINNIHLDVDPLNHNHIMVASQTGLYEYLSDKLISYIDSPFGAGAVMNATYDRKGNLWVFNRFGDKLYCYTSRLGFSEHEEYDVSSVGAINRYISSFFDSRGLLWFVNNHNNPLCFGFFQPSTKEWKVFTSFVNQDGTKMSDSHSAGKVVTEDKEGNIWIGASNFLAYLTPQDIRRLLAGTETNSIALTQHKISRNDGTGYADYLLNGVNFNDIKVDAANRKWIATSGSGVYLISSDNNTEVEHFTTANSPLLSDDVRSIALNENSGTIYFGTMKGLCSYTTDVNNSYGELNDDNVYAYPNPVTPDYTGPITITGLTENCQLKITNASGSVVHTGRSVGGSYQWNGCDQRGERVASGVYMVLIATKEGEKGCVTKITIIK